MPRPSPFNDATPGAKWWRVDFHAHTPFSTDAYQGANNVTHREWLLAHMTAEIDAVVISDHNGGGWIDGLKTNAFKRASAWSTETSMAVSPLHSATAFHESVAPALWVVPTGLGIWVGVTQDVVLGCLRLPRWGEREVFAA